uniref:Uncharacterized protein n=1 Tax=Enterococcus faecium TaxID=1352 RepID=A3QMZ9_ENTFC|nr:hypothetical protein [Enterococcus faecium]
MLPRALSMKLMATWLQFIICLNGEKMRLMKIITFLITHSVVFLKEKHKKILSINLSWSKMRK